MQLDISLSYPCAFYLMPPEYKYTHASYVSHYHTFIPHLVRKVPIGYNYFTSQTMAKHYFEKKKHPEIVPITKLLLDCVVKVSQIGSALISAVNGQISCWLCGCRGYLLSAYFRARYVFWDPFLFYLNHPLHCAYIKQACNNAQYWKLKLPNIISKWILLIKNVCDIINI